MHRCEANPRSQRSSCSRPAFASRARDKAALLLILLACAATLIVEAAARTPRAQTPIASGSSSPRRDGSASREVRAIWVGRTSIVSQPDVERVVGDAQQYGFNTLLVQVRGRGDAYFNGSIEPRADSLADQPLAFDPLQELITAAHGAGLQVHAWVSVNLAASATTLPTNRSHVVHTHPEWLMVPRALAATLRRVDPRRPEYVQQLAEWTRARDHYIEGLFVSPIPPSATTHTTAVLTDLVQRYAVDGVHLDYIRYPNDEFDYSSAALDAFRAEMRPKLTTETRARLDARRESAATAYADAFPDRWTAFRRARLTSLVARLAKSVRAVRPNVLVTAAVVPDPEDAKDVRLQDWPAWLERGFIDVICPMMYTSSAQQFVAQADLIEEAAGTAVWAGIGAWRLSPAETVRRIDVARARRFRGVALFSYDSLAARGQTFLKSVDRRAFQSSTDSSSGSR